MNLIDQKSALFALVAGFSITIGAGASDPVSDSQHVQVSRLEVKSRIASMEQVNVTAEKALDSSAPAPSSLVTALLSELNAIESGAEPESASEDAIAGSAD